MKKIIIAGLVLLSQWAFAQEECQLSLNKSENIKVVNVDDIRCIAQNSENENTVIFTFGLWCSPCRLHVKDAIDLKDKYDINLILLLSESEEDEIIPRSIKYLHDKDSTLEIVTVKDTYGKRQGQKYKNFIKEITPSDTKSILGMSKYIVLDKKGEVLKITSWKDNRENDWRGDHTKMLKKHVIPFLKPKQ